MKKLFALVIIVSMVVGCNSRIPIPARLSDTGDVNLISLKKVNAPAVQAAKGRDTILMKPIFTDSGAFKGHWGYDTFWAVRVNVDTERDANKKPIFDSVNKIWKMKTNWYYIQPKDSFRVKFIDK